MSWIHKKDYQDLKGFDDWLEYKKETENFTEKFLGPIVLALGVAFVFWIVGMGTFAEPLVEATNHQYVAACSAIGTEYVNGYCIDSANNQHRVLINEDGQAFIDGIRKPLIR